MNGTKKLFTSFAVFALIAFPSKVVTFDTSSGNSSPKKKISLSIEEENFEIGKHLRDCIDQLEDIHPQSPKDQEMIKYMKQKAQGLMEPYIMHLPKETRKKAPKKSRYAEGPVPFNLNED